MTPYYIYKQKVLKKGKGKIEREEEKKGKEEKRGKEKKKRKGEVIKKTRKILFSLIFVLTAKLYQDTQHIYKH